MKQLAIIILILIGSANASAKNSLQKSKHDFFQSNLGFKLVVPSCLSLKPEFADEDPDVKEAPYLVFDLHKGCSLQNYGSESIGLNLRKMSYEEASRKIEFEKKDINTRKALLFRDLSSFGKKKYLLIQETTSWKTIEARMYFFCKTGLAEFTVGTGANKPAPVALKEKIVKGDASLPVLLTELTDSFECNQK